MGGEGPAAADMIDFGSEQIAEDETLEEPEEIDVVQE